MKSYLAHPDLLREFTDDIKEIVNNQLGHDYLKEQQIRESFQPGGSLFMGVAFPDRTSDDDPPITAFYTSLPDGPSGRTRGRITFPEGIVQKPVGVCIGAVFSQQHLASYLNIGIDEYPDELIGKDPVGVIRTTAVYEDLQRNGIGTELVGKTIELLHRQNANTTLAVAWRSPTGVNIHSILVDNGLTPVNEYKDYWMEESRRYSYHCPECGAPPCRCSGLFYIG